MLWGGASSADGGPPASLEASLGRLPPRRTPAGQRLTAVPCQKTARAAVATNIAASFHEQGGNQCNSETFQERYVCRNRWREKTCRSFR
jgi:hypothetical protein